MSGGEVFYVQTRENGPAMFRVTGTTSSTPRAFVSHDAVIRRDQILKPEYNEKFGQIDCYHHRAGRSESLRVTRFLDESTVTLERVPRE